MTKLPTQLLGRLMNRNQFLRGAMILVLANTAWAQLPIAPGQTSNLIGIDSNSRLEGTVISDFLLPFEIHDNLGNLLLTGQYQDRVVRSDFSDELIFMPRILDVEAQGDQVAWITALKVDGFSEAQTRVEYRKDSLGEVAPNAVTRSPSPGDELHFRYSPNDITPPEEGKFLSIATNQLNYDSLGSVTIFAANDIGGLSFSTTIDGTNAPLIQSTPMSICDVNFSGTCDVNDLNLPDGLFSAGDLGSGVPVNPNNAHFDLNRNLRVDNEDLDVWLVEAATANAQNRPYFRGDANLDGVFNTTDLIQVFQAGQYEDRIAANSSWETGDWNGDREFTSGDVLAAFQQNGFSANARVASVPEPTSALGTLVVFGFALWAGRFRA